MMLHLSRVVALRLYCGPLLHRLADKLKTEGVTALQRLMDEAQRGLLTALLEITEMGGWEVQKRDGENKEQRSLKKMKLS